MAMIYLLDDNGWPWPWPWPVALRVEEDGCLSYGESLT